MWAGPAVLAPAEFDAIAHGDELPYVWNLLKPNSELTMLKCSLSRALTVSALALGAVGATAGTPGTCVPVSGTIVNNFPSATATLGVVEMTYGDSTKLKCALSGQATDGSSDINFVHTISCSDSIKERAYDSAGNLGYVPVHSSIVLRTTGSISPAQAPTQLFTFKETSTPLPGAPARGLFAGVTGGQIDVTGAVYTAPLPAPYGTPGSIDMTFKGKVCY